MKLLLPELACFAGLAVCLSHASAAEPRISFDFNAGTGTSAIGAKSNPAELIMLSPAKAPVSLYGEAGSGLTGKPEDFALDIGKTTQAMGAEGKTGGIAKIPEAAGVLGAMTSFTVTGWVKAASKFAGGARIVEYIDPAFGGFAVAVGPKVMTLSLNKKTVSTSYRPDNCFTEGVENQWVFFAVTYDGDKTSGNVVFYGGTATAEPQVITVANLDGGKTVELNRYGWLTIGNNGGGIRPFHGMLDDIAIYASGTDATGALSAEQITEIYKANLAGNPVAPK